MQNNRRTIVRSKRTDTLWQRILNHSKLNSKTKCLEWTGATRAFGYGIIGIGNRKCVGAHRAAWKIHNGAIKKGLCVLHKCDNPKCVNPRHLFLGTKKDNAQDMIAKGRIARGIKNGRSKISPAIVRVIRKSEKSHRELARIYNLNHVSIGDIKRRINWAWVK